VIDRTFVNLDLHGVDEGVEYDPFQSVIACIDEFVLSIYVFIFLTGYG